MSLCINPQCQNPDNSDNLIRCQSCGSELLLEGRYRVTCLLGEGGFAKTYEVSDRTIIPKVLKILTENRPKSVELFQREAQVLTKLNHPGIPQGEENFTFFPKDSQEPVYCLVMEKIEGENLYDWLNNRGDRPISEKQAIDWLTQLATTLHEVHQQQLIHRDIKPSNIMLKPDGQLVLIDFGIAREVTKTYEKKQAVGQLTKFVSDGYSPMEQINGKAVPQSDFFALGRTFVHLLTGISPLELCDQYNHDIYTDELENWRDKAPKISSNLTDFIDQLMARPVKKRPANTQAILERLIEINQTLYRQRLTISKSSNPSTIITGKNISLERTIGDWNSTGHALGVWSVAISPDGQTLVSGGRDGLIKVWKMKTGEEIYTTYEHSNIVYSVAISLDGQTLVSGSVNSMYACNLATGKLDRWFPVSGSVFSVAISPNCQTIVSGGTDEAVTLWQLSTGEKVRTLTWHSQAVRSIAISSNGSTVVSCSNDKTIKVWGKFTLTGHLSSVIRVAISPDSQILVSSSEDETIKVWNLNSGEEIYTLTEDTKGVYAIAISPDGQTLVGGSITGKVKMWELSTGKEIHTIAGHFKRVNALAFSPDSTDGQILVSASDDCTIKVWKIQ